MKHQITSLEPLASFVNTCHEGWLKGWHERNGGNLSYRLCTEDLAPFLPFLSLESNYRPIDISLPSLGNDFFLITGSGKFMKNVKVDPESNIGMVQIHPSGNAYRIVWGLQPDALPSSELVTHLMTHAVKKAQHPESNCALLHAHPANVIALSFVLPLNEPSFSKELWEMLSECIVVFPEGLGVLPWILPGSIQLAKATQTLMEQFNAVLWAHHGLFCAGNSLDQVFGLVDTIEKAAEILVKVLSMGGKKQRPSPSELLSLAEIEREMM
jgi:rhamnulose-1-phosphate aldolase